MSDWQTRYWVSVSVQALRLFLVQDDGGAGHAELLGKA